MSIRILILGVDSVTVSYLIPYDTLLQNAADITKCDRVLVQSSLGFSLQNATVITKCDVYYKVRQYIV